MKTLAILLSLFASLAIAAPQTLTTTADQTITGQKTFSGTSKLCLKEPLGTDVACLNAPALASSTVALTLPALDGTLATLAGTETLTNKSIDAGQLTGSIAAARMPALTGDVTTSAGSVAATIANNAVTLGKMAQVATARFLGRTTASTGDVEALTGTQATALLNAVVGDSGSGGTKGLVPAPASGDAAASKFLKADGTWATVTSGGDVTGPGSSTADGLALFNGTTGKIIKDAGGGLGTGVLTFLGTPSSANLRSALTDETGTSGGLVFAGTPTLVTPVLGVATATSINKMAITAPATGSTLTIDDGKTFRVAQTLNLNGSTGKTLAFNNDLTFQGTDNTTFTFPASGNVMVWDGSVGTSGRVPVSSTSGRQVDADTFRFDTTNGRLMLGTATSVAGNDLYLSKTTNGQVGAFVLNGSTGTAAFGIIGAYNAANGIQMLKYSSGYTTAGLIVAEAAWLQNMSGPLLIGNSSATDIIGINGGSATTNERFRADSAGNFSIGNAAIATNATDGFLYIPTMAGAPSGTPTTKTGRAPIVYDTTNDKLCAYRGGWKCVTLTP